MMKQFSFLLIAFTVSITILTGCSKNSNGCYYDAEPPTTFLQIKQNGEPLPNDVLAGVTMYYISNGKQKNINDLSPATDAYANQGILVSRQIGTFESEVFYITYKNSSDIDTLSVKNLMPTPETNCQYKTEEINFNNAIAKPDTNFIYQPVYVCLKK